MRGGNTARGRTRKMRAPHAHFQAITQQSVSLFTYLGRTMPLRILWGRTLKASRARLLMVWWGRWGAKGLPVLCVCKARI